MLKLIEREKARTDRTGWEFSLVVFRAKSARGDAAPPEWLASAVRRRARISDEVEVFGTAVCTLLIATPKEGAYSFAESIVAHEAAAAVPVRFKIHTYPSYASLPDLQDQGLTHCPDGSGGDGAKRRPDPYLRHDRKRHNGNSRKQPAVLMAGYERLYQSEYHAQDQLGEANDLPPEFEAFQPLPRWKRAADLVGASLALLLLVPVMLILALAIKVVSPGPVIFRQVRAGRGGHPFTLYKFRSMHLNAEAMQEQLRAMSEQDGPAFKLKADPRMTRLGRFLRITSLDELPQLWNVLKGDMSLVGPRPLPWKEACGCKLWQRRRLDVVPGMTCIWQVKGRSRVSFAEWMRMDRLYIRKRSFITDLVLLAATIPAVLFRRGAS